VIKGLIFAKEGRGRAVVNTHAKEGQSEGEIKAHETVNALE
jgi:hypothetical protein